MATFGAKYIVFSKFSEKETDQKKPQYETTPRTLGALMTADLTEEFQSAELYGDDVLQETVTMFTGGQLQAELSDVNLETLAYVIGGTYNNGNLSRKATDLPPWGGLGYIRVLINKGVQIYQGVFLSKVIASIPGQKAESKAGSIKLNGQSLNFAVKPPIYSQANWVEQQDFTTEEDAKNWLLERFSNN